MDSQNKFIGKSLARVDARIKVQGREKFITDMFIDGMLYAYPVFSSIPFGKIKKVDISQAGKVDGFIGYIDSGDIKGINQVGVIKDDQPLFAENIVRFIGDVVGCTIAETENAAFRAARLVKVDYEEYIPYFTIEDSIAGGERLIHHSNEACSHNVLKGDIERGFSESYMIVEAEFKTPLQEHYYFEPQGCLVIPETDGSVHVLGSLQCPFYVRKAVAQVLGTPQSMVRVTQTPTGGAFGGKEDVPSELCARAAVGAVKTGRPIKMVYRRSDDIQATSKRHAFKMKYKVGVSNDGRLIAADVSMQLNAGAYTSLTPVVSYRSAMQALGPYNIPHVRVCSKSYFTNLPPAGAFRGFGSPQATFGHERMMDIVSEKLGIDPFEFRMMNIIKSGDTTQTGHRLLTSVGAIDTLEQVRQASLWKKGSPTEKRNHYLYGMGIATSHYGNCLGAAGWYLDGAGVKIQIHRDGSISIAFGLTEMGQGALTAVVQMSAEALGVNPRRVRVIPTDTQNVPDSGPSVASRNVVMTGNAIKDAADKLNPVLLSCAAEMMETDEKKILIENDTITDVSTGRMVSFEELTDYLFTQNKQMDQIGWWHVPELKYEPETGFGEAYFTYSYATHAAKVRIDTLTGKIRVLKVWAVHDVGKAINPAGIEGQVEGGVAQGAGWAVLENLQFEGGNITTDNLTTYLIPTMTDVPEVETSIVEEYEPLGPWGAKGIGEPAIIPTAAAIANAVSRAVGKQFNHLPITPEQVLDALAKG